MFGRRRHEQKIRKRFDKSMPRTEHTNGRGGEVADWTYGNVWTRVYRNRRQRTRQVYYTWIQDRLYQRPDGTVGLSKTFYPEDMQHSYAGICQARSYIAQNTHEERNRRGRRGADDRPDDDGRFPVRWPNRRQ
jgi:hypothetical protein